MRKVLVDSEAEVESPPFIHALVRVDSQGKVEDIVGIREVGFHRAAEGELVEVWM